MTKIQWTDDDIEAIIRETEAGTPARKIAAELAINRSTIQCKIAELRAAGKISAQHNREWTDEDVALVVQLTQDGATAPEIADVIGRSVPSVNSKLTKLRRAGVLPWRGQGAGPKSRKKREPDAEMRALLHRFTAACERIKEATGYGR